MPRPNSIPMARSRNGRRTPHLPPHSVGSKQQGAPFTGNPNDPKIQEEANGLQVSRGGNNDTRIDDRVQSNHLQFRDTLRDSHGASGNEEEGGLLRDSRGLRFREESQDVRLQEGRNKGFARNDVRLQEGRTTTNGGFGGNGLRHKEGAHNMRHTEEGNEIRSSPPQSNGSKDGRLNEGSNGVQGREEGGNRQIKDSTDFGGVGGNGLRHKEGSHNVRYTKEGSEIRSSLPQSNSLRVSKDGRLNEGSNGVQWREEGSNRRNKDSTDLGMQAKEHIRRLRPKEEDLHTMEEGAGRDKDQRGSLAGRLRGAPVNEQLLQLKDHRAGFSASVSAGKEVKKEGGNYRAQQRKGHGHGHAPEERAMARAKELKEEGNRQFQKKDYAGAMTLYKQALDLTPSNHPDRAVFHSNRAACLMQMLPVRYDAAIQECTFALEVQPGFSRALLRRARAFEAIGKHELALDDVQTLLQADGSHPDALDLVKRLRTSLQNLEEAQQNSQSRSTAPHLSRSASAVFTGTEQDRCTTSPYMRSASAVFTGSDCDYRSDSCSQMGISGKSSGENASFDDEMLNAVFPTPSLPVEHAPDHVDFSSSFQALPDVNFGDKPSLGMEETMTGHDSVDCVPTADSSLQVRQLKLIYHEDIRLAELPANYKFNELRNLVKTRFSFSRAVLIKYKDMEGDLVTITCTNELRLAELAAASEATRRTSQVVESTDYGLSLGENCRAAIGLPVESSGLQPLRLYVVEVPPEQEPMPKGEDVWIDVNSKEIGLFSDKSHLQEKHTAEKALEADMDNWLLDFAHLFQTHLGIDPGALNVLQELGIELLSKAFGETITNEEAKLIFEQAALKFQEVAARAFLNLGNIHMCAARKQHGGGDTEIEFCDRLQAAFDWAQTQFALAEENFKKALQLMPDLYEGALGLGQKDFENAKLHWSLAIARQVDLCTWDSFYVLELFKTAEKGVEQAARILENSIECSNHEIPLVLKRNNSTGSNFSHHLAEVGSLEQGVVSRTQMYLFWGNILYEHSQVEFRLGVSSWNKLLEEAMHKFEVAGVSSSDISIALQNHLSSSLAFLDLASAAGHATKDVENENTI